MMFAFISCVACENVPSDDQVITMINKLDEEQTLPLFGGLSLEKVDNSGDISPRSESLTDRIIRYFQSHKVNFELSEARTNVGGKIKPVIVKKVKKARGKLKKLMLPILLALKFKTAVILPIAFTILSLISLKALKVGLVALILAASSFVKEFFAKKQEKITTAYISANPSNSGFNAEIVSDWNRNGAPAGDLAYNAYNNNNYQTLPQNV
ncbi:CLUMA_CG000856, isoform A [Clunio marinus]|uniref:CLUMA_CG000856, isoform A n=1 Tax=Clunio marinus TaxID=568069 RepID=A0A1J1HGH9_9DIPT|nr:CLUMA_CG000856, isoform A [Clunio marinus]